MGIKKHVKATDEIMGVLFYYPGKVQEIYDVGLTPREGITLLKDDPVATTVKNIEILDDSSVMISIQTKGSAGGMIDQNFYFHGIPFKAWN